MPRQWQHFLLKGGLDLETSPLAVEPGRILSSLNYEPVDGGYRRLRGYERFDGRPRPSDAPYWIVSARITDDEVPARAGDMITNGTVTAVVLAVTADRTGYVVGDMTGGEFADGDVLEVMRVPTGNELTWQGDPLSWQNEILTWQ